MKRNKRKIFRFPFVPFHSVCSLLSPYRFIARLSRTEKMLKRGLIFSLALALVFSMPGAGKADDGALKLPPYKKVKLKNGMTLLLMEQREIPLISFNFTLKTGSTADPAGREGVAALAAELLRKGTKTRSADQLSAELDFIGGQLNVFTTLDYTSGRAEFLKKDLN